MRRGRIHGDDSQVLGVAAVTEKDRQILSEFARRVRSRFPDASIWAYGSRVRGDAEPDSDLDVCIVLDGLDEASDQEIVADAWEVGFAGDVVISTVTFSWAEFTSGPLTQSPLVAAVRRDGVAA